MIGMLESTNADVLHEGLEQSWGHEPDERGDPPTLAEVRAALNSTQGHWTIDEQGRVTVTESGKSYVVMLDDRYDNSGGYGNYR